MARQTDRQTDRRTLLTGIVYFCDIEILRRRKKSSVRSREGDGGGGLVFFIVKRCRYFRTLLLYYCYFFFLYFFFHFYYVFMKKKKIKISPNARDHDSPVCYYLPYLLRRANYNDRVFVIFRLLRTDGGALSVVPHIWRSRFSTVFPVYSGALVAYNTKSGIKQKTKKKRPKLKQQQQNKKQMFENKTFSTAFWANENTPDTNTRPRSRSRKKNAFFV